MVFDVFVVVDIFQCGSCIVIYESLIWGVWGCLDCSFLDPLKK